MATVAVRKTATKKAPAKNAAKKAVKKMAMLRKSASKKAVAEKVLKKIELTKVFATSKPVGTIVQVRITQQKSSGDYYGEVMKVVYGGAARKKAANKAIKNATSRAKRARVTVQGNEPVPPAPEIGVVIK